MKYSHSKLIFCLNFLFFSFCHCQLSNILSSFGEIFYNNDVISDNNKVLRSDYDFIVIGAGSGGSVVANRLSENKNWTILLLEAGNEENFFTDVPLMAAFQSATAFNWGYTSEKSNTSCLSLKNRRCNVVRGKALGGTSVINFLIYTRGNKLDYEEWKNYGNEGWGYQDLLPYFIKSENCSSDVEIDESFHGRNGYLHVQHPPYNTPMLNRFLKAGFEFGLGNTDPNGRSQLGFSKVQATMIDGRRQSASKAFLKPIRKRPNLHVLTQATVTKILIHPNSKRTYGVEFHRNGIRHKIIAKKEVILSAGAVNSPQLLMLSGIGPKEDLERFNIPVIKNLKVGYNLQDHFSMAQTFLINESVTVSDLGIQNPSVVFDYVVNGKGPMTIPGGAEALAFIKTKFSADRNDDYPDMELVLGAGGVNNDLLGSLRHLFRLPNNLFYKTYGSVLFTPGFSISSVLLKPRSRGRVTIKNTDPFSSPVVNFNYFGDETDMLVMVEGFKMARKLGESQHFKRYNAKLYEYTIPGCEHLSQNSDEHHACLIRNLATSIGHLVGTCKMGPSSDPDSVVDSQLKVHGINGLRVVDGSIMPTIITGHTNSVIMMIGEKASDLIKDTWRTR